MEADPHKDSRLPSSAIPITGLGALTPVGENAQQSFAAFNAGLVAFAEHDYITCTPEEPEWDQPLPMFAAQVPILEPTMQGVERFIQLAIPPLDEALAQAGLARSDLASTGMFVALPGDPAMAALNLQQSLVQPLLKRMGLTSLTHIQVFSSGHIAPLEALHNAAEALRQDSLKHVIVLAVDSYLLDQRVAYYDERWRVKSERNVDGFIPGEAACALLVELASTASSRKANIHAAIKGSGFAMESNALGGDKSSSGEGLAQAVQGAIASCEPVTFTQLYADFNGESYYAYELGLLQSRFAQEFATVKNIRYPATSIGDTGAAAGALSVLFACQGKTSHEHTLLTCASDDGKRAALVLETV